MVLLLLQVRNALKNLVVDFFVFFLHKFFLVYKSKIAIKIFLLLTNSSKYSTTIKLLNSYIKLPTYVLKNTKIIIDSLIKVS